ncbi:MULTISPECIES: hypothetical protein [unclassified Rhizobium]|uniref:hypothetical protein n=1 Tax=unclassified Rhizobium TaxID=2613769 RepID=UPI001A985A78|nr:MULTISPECIES: hypothetical protein [unclassified Rhizobium]MBX5156349.1 hypothetical protein [Rhizobium sp. NZLR8]MBX5162478.1 hypothetical protein [Rhizobium sp. NZLR4b]MBX5173962.1 hypothetical protein [Rhizobium sp. NZLR1b]MBX5187332.1 hypothetical protein [Rhizobium sp. NZLR3b]MBX5193725.1 hypothetical protein [Rhizobium sp. NZLR10]
MELEHAAGANERVYFGRMIGITPEKEDNRSCSSIERTAEEGVKLREFVSLVIEAHAHLPSER